MSGATELGTKEMCMNLERSSKMVVSVEGRVIF
jgi:hypothetical protein